MALTANLEVSRFVDQGLRLFPVYQSVHVYKGSLLGFYGGYVRPLVAGDQFAGVAYEEKDNTSGQSGDLNVRSYTEGDFVLPLTSAAVTGNGRGVYASDDATVVYAMGSNSLIGSQLTVHTTANYAVVRIYVQGNKQVGLPHLGTETYPFTLTSAQNFGQVYVRSNVASGTARGLYLRHYMAGGVGGEALRAFATCENAAPVDTVNGAHVSLNFGSSAGNVTGLGCALRATLHCNARSITGTTAALQAELYGEASGDVGGAMSCIRCVLDGSDGTALTNLLTKAYLMDIAAAAGEGNMVEAGSTLGTAYGGLKVRVNGTPMYIPLYVAAPS